MMTAAAPPSLRAELIPDALTRLITGKRVLVTGGAGAIGSVLTRCLLVDNDVTVLDNLSSGYRENLPEHPRLTFVHDDLLFEETLQEVFAEPYDLIFHLAANFANQNSVDHPQKDLLVNGLGTLRLLQMARRTGCERFVLASSSCVYGDCGGLAISESAPGSSETPYAMTKRLGEEYAFFFHRAENLPVTVVRYFNSYGPGERPGLYRNAIPNMLARAMAGLPLSVFGTGEETRDFTFVADTVQGTLLAAVSSAAVGEAFNIGTGRETRVVDLARAINNLTSNSAGLVMVPRRSWDAVSRRCADIGKARKLLGYAPTVTVDDGLALTHQWLRTLDGPLLPQSAEDSGRSSARDSQARGAAPAVT